MENAVDELSALHDREKANHATFLSQNRLLDQAMTIEECNSLAAILSELAAARERENGLLSRLTTLLNSPPPEMPAHLAKVCAEATELFAEDAARFLTTPHWELHGSWPSM